MKCSRMPMQTVTVVSGIGLGIMRDVFPVSHLKYFPVGPSSRRWSSPSLWAGWACQGAGPGPRQWPALPLAPPPVPSPCLGWPGWHPQVTRWSPHIMCIYYVRPRGRGHGRAAADILGADGRGPACSSVTPCHKSVLSVMVTTECCTDHDQVTPGNKRRSQGSFEDWKLQSLCSISSDDWYNR